MPKHFVQALIAVEDRSYFSHAGFDLRGLARAARSVFSDKVQGGSTITQQLVKNFFLTPERTLQRKFTELLMAVLLEIHYDKNEILETYLNEIYFGQDRDRAIHGVGLAAQFYFGKEVQYLTAGRIGAARRHGARARRIYDPLPPSAARARAAQPGAARNARPEGRSRRTNTPTARGSPLNVSKKTGMGTTPYPAFLQLVHRQLRRDYDEADLRSEGLRIFTTLDPRVQEAAETALAKRLAQFDKEKRFGRSPGSRARWWSPIRRAARCRRWSAGATRATAATTARSTPRGRSDRC